MQDNNAKPGTLDLSGRWWVKHHVESSNRSRFVGLDIEFHITLRQDDDKLSGEGEKFIVDARLAGRDEASRLDLAGSVEGTDIHLSLIEHSPAAPGGSMVGAISWKALDADRLVGTFRVDQHDTSGTSEAVRHRGSSA